MGAGRRRRGRRLPALALVRAAAGSGVRVASGDGTSDDLRRLGRVGRNGGKRPMPVIGAGSHRRGDSRSVWVISSGRKESELRRY